MRFSNCALAGAEKLRVQAPAIARVQSKRNRTMGNLQQARSGARATHRRTNRARLANRQGDCRREAEAYFTTERRGQSVFPVANRQRSWSCYEIRTRLP